MPNYSLPVILLLILASCNNNKNREPFEETAAVAAAADTLTWPSATDTTAPVATKHRRRYVDSFRIEMDSLLKADIMLPPIYRAEVLKSNDKATAKFTELSNACNGKIKVLVNSSLVAEEVQHVINTESVPKSDLLILIDKTYSMANDIATVKESMDQIIDTIKKYKGTRLAIGLYGDKNTDGMEWYSFRNFETNYDLARVYLEGVKVTGGGDWPESVYDAIMRSLDEDFWQSTTKRNIILIGDAPSLEKPLSNYTLDDVIAKAKSGNVVMNFYPIILTPEVEKARVSPEEVRKYQPVKLATALYPNPTTGHIDVGFADCGTYYLELYNAAGQLMFTDEKFGLSWSKDLDTLANGMYILRIINTDHKFELMKFVLQR